MFLLVPAYLGCLRSKAVKQSSLLLLLLVVASHMAVAESQWISKMTVVLRLEVDEMLIVVWRQIGGIRFLYDNVVESLEQCKISSGLGCILAHSMGLGKTLQVVAFVDIFLRHTSARCVLIIVPVNTLQNWVAEFDMWLPAPESVRCCGTGMSDPVDIWHRSFSLYILNESMKTSAARAKVICEYEFSHSEVSFYFLDSKL